MSHSSLGLGVRGVVLGGEGTVYTVYYDDGTGAFCLDGKFDGKVEFKGAKIRCYKYDEQSLIIYAVNDDGYVLFEMSMADGLVVISSLYSSVTRLPAGSFYYPSKTS